MKATKKNIYATRDSILKLLSDEEVAKVSLAETATKLSEGDEYLDLGDLETGVRKALGTSVPMDRVLPRKAVQEQTWTKILAHLDSKPAALPSA